MTNTKSHDEPAAARSKAAVVVWGLVSIIAGCALAAPFLGGAAAWEWSPAASGLADATINAESSISDGALRLRPLPGRKMSVIAPPGEWDSGDYIGMTVEMASAAGPLETDVVLFWQSPGATTYRFTTRRVQLNQSPTAFAFPLGSELYWSGKIGRVGVQWPSLSGEVVFRHIALDPLPMSHRPRAAWRQLTAAHPWDNTASNYLIGPVLLGIGLNAWLVALAAFAVGCYATVRSMQARRPCRATMAVVVLGAWLLGDALMTVGMARQAGFDVEHLAGSTDPAALLYGPDLAACRDMILRGVPAGAKFCVVSDDAYYPLHRIGYQVMPQRVRLPIERLEQADFIAVYHASGARFDAVASALECNGRRIAAQMVEQLGPSVYLLRRAGG